MTKINFYIEEDALIKQLLEIKEKHDDLRVSVATMEAVCDDDVCELFSPPDFYSISYKEQTIGEIIYSKVADGDVRDTLLQLQISLDKSKNCETNDQESSIGLASLLRAGIGALISIGDLSLIEKLNPERMVLVTSPTQVKSVLRKLYTVSKIPEDLFPIYCASMFDNIYFHASPREIKAMSLGYENIIDQVIRHFTYLNDFATDDFERYPLPQDIIQRAGAHGVEISPESPKTHKNRKAMMERDITISGETLCCEWHTKIENTQGRIHFYARRARPESIKLKSGDKVIVGIIIDHLT